MRDPGQAEQGDQHAHTDQPQYRRSESADLTQTQGQAAFEQDDGNTQRHERKQQVAEQGVGIEQTGRRTQCKAGDQQQQNGRSEEHTSELPSLMRISYADFGLKQKTDTRNN